MTTDWSALRELAESAPLSDAAELIAAIPELIDRVERSEARANAATRKWVEATAPERLAVVAASMAQQSMLSPSEAADLIKECGASFVEEQLATVTAERDAALAVIEQLRVAASALLQASNDIHPVYGSTSACHGGIGGQAMTEHCAQVCSNPKHDAAKVAFEDAKVAVYRALAAAVVPTTETGE